MGDAVGVGSGRRCDRHIQLDIFRVAVGIGDGQGETVLCIARNVRIGLITVAAVRINSQCAVFACKFVRTCLGKIGHVVAMVSDGNRHGFACTVIRPEVVMNRTGYFTDG